MQQAGISDARRFYTKYWSAFREPARARGVMVPAALATTNITFRAYRGVFFTLNAVSEKRELRVELVLTPPDGPDLFRALKSEASAIESGVGAALLWLDDTPGRLRVSMQREADLVDESQWPDQHRWLLDGLEQFSNALLPRLGPAAQYIRPM